MASDPSRQIVRLASGPASYTDEGSGAVVVAIHGLPGSARDFRHLAPHLTERARFVRVELPGFGETPIASGPDPSPLGRARFVQDVCEALGLDKPLVLGHSMGGVVAAATVSLAPSAYSGLALLSSPGLREHTMLRRFPFKALGWLLSGPARRRIFMPAVRRLFAAGGFRGYPDHEIERTLACVSATSTALHAERVRDLRLPTLVGWCADDKIIEEEIFTELAAACPDGPRLRFESGGHNPQKSHAAEIGAALTEWLGVLTR